MPALVIAQLLTFIGTSFGYIFLPVISEVFAKKNLEVLQIILNTVSKWILAIIAPIFLFIALSSREILTLLYGAEYSSGYPVLIILAFGISIGTTFSILGNILVGSGNTKMNLMAEILAAVTNVILNIQLIPTLGIKGAALGTSISYIIRSLSFLLFTFKKINIHPLNKNYAKIILACVCSFGIIYLVKALVSGYINWIVLMLLLGLLLILFYSGFLLAFRFLDKYDQTILKTIESKTSFKLNLLEKFISD
jgi:O-antigen/teichoic acid export membrane protein